MEQHHISQAYEIAAETIKNAILQGQYEAAKGVNRIQLTTYFSVGKYVSANTRQGVWGTGALEAISTRLRQLLPGLRGYSADSLKLMRIFYEEWKELDATWLMMTFIISPTSRTTLQPLSVKVIWYVRRLWRSRMSTC